MRAAQQVRVRLRTIPGSPSVIVDLKYGCEHSFDAHGIAGIPPAEIFHDSVKVAGDFTHDRFSMIRVLAGSLRVISLII
jgi:hypothetical protein